MAPSLDFAVTWPEGPFHLKSTVQFRTLFVYSHPCFTKAVRTLMEGHVVVKRKTGQTQQDKRERETGQKVGLEEPGPQMVLLA